MNRMRTRSQRDWPDEEQTKRSFTSAKQDVSDFDKRTLSEARSRRRHGQVELRLGKVDNEASIVVGEHRIDTYTLPLSTFGQQCSDDGLVLTSALNGDRHFLSDLFHRSLKIRMIEVII